MNLKLSFVHHAQYKQGSNICNVTTFTYLKLRECAALHVFHVSGICNVMSVHVQVSVPTHIYVR